MGKKVVTLPVVRVESLEREHPTVRCLRKALDDIELILLPSEQTNWLSADGKRIMEIIRASRIHQ